MYFEPADANLGANDLYKHMVAVMLSPSGVQAHGMYGAFSVPQNYVSAPNVVIVWNTTATTGVAQHRFNYRAVAGAESLDQASHQESVTGTSTAGGTARNRVNHTMALTAGNFAVGDLVEWFLERFDAGSADTLTASSYIHDVLFQYSDA